MSRYPLLEMSPLPPAQTPLNQHSLSSLEDWLIQLGAKRSKVDPCKWHWLFSNWTAEITLDQDELRIIWDKSGKLSHCCFPYGLSRSDVEIAIKEGPSKII